MKAIVIRTFWDMQDPEHPTYHEGDEFEGTDERVTGLEERGFVKAAPQPKKAAPRKRSAKPKE